MRKLLTIAAKILLGLLLFPIAVLLFFWIKNILFIGGVNSVNTSYLVNNKKDINRKEIKTNSDIELFNDTFYENQVFLLGENHGYADVQLIDKYMITHLNKKLGIRYYLAEMDSIRAKTLNQFLLNNVKDTLMLKQVISDIKMRIPQQSSKELYQKWFDIYDYNRSLPDSLKIIVLGLDKNFDDESTKISRDSAFLINFKNLVDQRRLQNEKFYGYFGYTHVLQNGFSEKNIRPFGAKLKKSNFSFATKIQSIVCFTLESEMYMPKNDQYPSPPDERISIFNVNGPMVVVKGIKDLKEVTEKNTITLFNLNNNDSPYMKSQNLAGIKVNALV